MFSNLLGKKKSDKDIQQSHNMLEKARNQWQIFDDKALTFYMTVQSCLLAEQKFQANLQKNFGSEATLTKLIEAATKTPEYKIYADHMSNLIIKMMNECGYEKLSNQYNELIFSYEKLCALLDESIEKEILSTKNSSYANDKTIDMNEERKKYFNEVLANFDVNISPTSRFKLCQNSYEHLYKVVSAQGLDGLAQNIYASINKNNNIQTSHTQTLNQYGLHPLVSNKTTSPSKNTHSYRK